MTCKVPKVLTFNVIFPMFKQAAILVGSWEARLKLKLNKNMFFNSMKCSMYRSNLRNKFYSKVEVSTPPSTVLSGGAYV